MSSLWCNLHGHRKAEIDAAIRAQLDRIAHATTLGMSSTPAVELAKVLADVTPGDLRHTFFSSDGASAVEAAIKMCLQYWRQCERPRPEKTRYLALGSAYHGDTIGATSVGGVARFHKMFGPLLFEVVRPPVPDVRRLPPGTPPEEATAVFLRELEEVLAESHETVAAMLIEPMVQGAAGMIMHPPGYLRGVRELTRKYDVLLVADEIVTGFGRTGRMFGCEHEGVVPDLMCLGKSITGGYLPLSATVVGPRVFDAFLGSFAEHKTFYHGHTYGGNPIACAAALASVGLTRKPEFAEAVARGTRRMAEILEPLKELPGVADVRQLGMIAGVELAQGGDLRTPFDPNERIGWRVCQEAVKRGVWLRPLGDVVVVMPPVAAGDEEFGLLAEVLPESIVEVTGGGAR